MAVGVGRGRYWPGVQTYWLPFQLQCPGFQAIPGDGGTGGVSICGGGGAKGAATGVIVPALLGTAAGGVPAPYCGGAGTAVAGAYGREDAIGGGEFGGR